jgi:hypothetical protein
MMDYLCCESMCITLKRGVGEIHQSVCNTRGMLKHYGTDKFSTYEKWFSTYEKTCRRHVSAITSVSSAEEFSTNEKWFSTYEKTCPGHVFTVYMNTPDHEDQIGIFGLAGFLVLVPLEHYISSRRNPSLGPAGSKTDSQSRITEIPDPHLRTPWNMFCLRCEAKHIFGVSLNKWLIV